MHQHVVGRNVAMHEPQRLSLRVGQIVRVLQAGRGHRDDLAHLRDREDLAQLLRSLGDGAKARPVDELHRDEVVPVGLAQVVDADDVRVVEAGGEARLVEEHLHELPVAGEVRKDALEADQLLEAGCAGLPRQVDLGHPAGGDELDELVLAQRAGHRGGLG